MGKYFDRAYDYAMTKLAAFDIDDEEDQRLYNKIKDDPRTNEWRQGTHDELKNARNFLRNVGIGAGAVGLGSGLVAAASKRARPIAVPIALTGGLVGAGGALGALQTHGEMKSYDRGDPGVRRRTNIERYMVNHGSQYAGRRAQREAEMNRSANALNSLILADAIAGR